MQLSSSVQNLPRPSFARAMPCARCRHARRTATSVAHSSCRSTRSHPPSSLLTTSRSNPPCRGPRTRALPPLRLPAPPSTLSGGLRPPCLLHGCRRCVCAPHDGAAFRPSAAVHGHAKSAHVEAHGSHAGDAAKLAQLAIVTITTSSRPPRSRSPCQRASLRRANHKFAVQNRDEKKHGTQPRSRPANLPSMDAWPRRR